MSCLTPHTYVTLSDCSVGGPSLTSRLPPVNTKTFSSPFDPLQLATLLWASLLFSPDTGINSTLTLPLTLPHTHKHTCVQCACPAAAHQLLATDSCLKLACPLSAACPHQYSIHHTSTILYIKHPLQLRFIRLTHFTSYTLSPIHQPIKHPSSYHTSISRSSIRHYLLALHNDI